MAVVPLPNAGSAALLKGAAAQARGARMGSFPSGLATAPPPLPADPMPQGHGALAAAGQEVANQILHGAAPPPAPVANVPTARLGLPPPPTITSIGPMGAPLPPPGAPNQAAPMDDPFANMQPDAGPSLNAEPIVAPPDESKPSTKPTPSSKGGFWSAFGHESASGFLKVAQAFLGNFQTGLGTPIPVPNTHPLTSQQMAAGRAQLGKMADQQAKEADESTGVMGFLGRTAGGVTTFAAQPEAVSGADLINSYQAARARGDSRTVSALTGIIKASMDEFLARFTGEGKVATKLIPKLAAHPIVAHMVQTAGASVGAQILGTEAQKAILTAAGDKKGAAELHPFDPGTLAVYALTPFAIEGAHRLLLGGGPRAVAPEPPASEDNGEPAPPAGPSVNASAVVPASAGATEPVTMPRGEVQLPGQPAGMIPGPSSVVPDHPTTEPEKDILAQWADMMDNKTPRRGVLLPKGQEVPEKLAKRLAQAREQGRAIPLEQGTLIARTAKDAIRFRAALKAGTDPQAVIGEATGAGTGKTPEHTMAVQGMTPEGAVAKESAVTPAEVPAKVAEMAAEGKTPVVTTPKEVIERRAAEIQAEGPTPEPQPPAAEAAAPAPEGNGRPPLRQEYDPAQKLLDEQVKKDAEAAAANPNGKRPPLRQGEDAAEPILEAQARADANRQPVEPPKEPNVVPFKDKDGREPATSVAIKREGDRLRAEDEAAREARINEGAEAVKGMTDREAATRKLIYERNMVGSEAHEALKRAGVPEYRPRSEEKVATGVRFGKPSEKPAEPATVTPIKPPEPAKPTYDNTTKQHLAEALEDFQQQEANRPKRQVGGVKLRAENVGAFARVVKTAAKLLFEKGEITPERAAFASRVAGKVERIDTKSEEAFAKNKGVGHPMLTEHAHNLMEAARGILDENHEPQEAEKAKTTRARERAQKAVKPLEERKAPAPKAAEPEKVKVMEDIHDEREPIPLTKQDQLRLQQASKEFLSRSKDPAERTAREAKLRKLLDELVDAGKMRPGDRETILAWHEGEVRDRAKPPGKRREEEEDEIEREMGVHGIDYGSAEEDDFEAPRRQLGHRLMDQFERAGQALISHMFRNPGHTFRLHQVLDFLDQLAVHDGHPDLGPAHQVLKLIRKYAPDIEVKPVDVIRDGRGKAAPGAAGMHRLLQNDIQILRRPGPGGVQTILHEAVHAGTVDFMVKNPDHPLTKEMERLRQIAIARAKRMLGDEVVQNTLDFFNRKHTDQSNVIGDLYGLHNIAEFAAEAHTHGPFQHFLMESEAHSTWAERRSLGGTLKHAIATAVKKLFGIEDKSAAGSLFDRVLDTTEQLMQAQVADKARTRAFWGEMNGEGDHAQVLDMDRQLRQRLSDLEAQRDAIWKDESLEPGERLERVARVQGDIAQTAERIANLGRVRARSWVNEQRAAREELPLDSPAPLSRADQAIHALAALREEPGTIHGEDEIRRNLSPTAADTARDFVSSTRKGAIGHLRTLFNWAKGADQLLRDNQVFFGADDESNPVNRLRDTMDNRVATRNRMLAPAQTIVRDAMRLPTEELTRLGALANDATIYGIDPSQPKPKSSDPKFDARWDEFQARWRGLSRLGRSVFERARDYNRWALDQQRVHAIDAVLRSFSDTPLNQAQKDLLYKARTAGQFQNLIGPGKAIDIGERNGHLVKVLQHTATFKQVAGPFFHLGRHGDYVVQAKPEGARLFKTQALAEHFAERVRDLSPESDATISQTPDGRFRVDYQAEYVSMHQNPHEAEQAVARLKAAGLEPGVVTKRILSQGQVPGTAGLETLIGDATRRLRRTLPDDDAAAQSLVGSLRDAFTSILASRSSAVASRLARRGVGGVKPEEWLRNFSDHAQSTAFHTANLATAFDTGEVLGHIREMAKDPDQPQRQAYKRGEFMTELGRRMTQQTSIMMDTKNIINHIGARLGFMNYLVSPSHAVIWSTQNFTTAIPVAGARFGYARSMGAFGHSMATIFGNEFRTAFLAHLMPGTYDTKSILDAAVRAVREDPKMGKWAPQLQAMLDRGLVSSSFSNELEAMAANEPKAVHRVFDYARLMPQFADVFNRISTGLAALELTGGDVRKSLDFVRETHIDYSPENKSRMFKTFGRIPGGNSILMFRTYAQGMFHLLYSNIAQMRYQETKSWQEAAKTVAGLVLSMGLFAGVTKAAVLEPIRFGVWAYHKIFGDKDRYYDLDNSIRQFVHDQTGSEEATQLITGGLPRALGFDLSSRMGLSDLLLYNPPDLLTSNKDTWQQFGAELLGPMFQLVANGTTSFMSNMQSGHIGRAFMSAVPVKAFHDGLSAYQYYTQGYRSSGGGQETPPSTADAVWRAIGFKPADVAAAQEREGAVAGYRSQIENRRWALIRQLASADEAQRAKLRPEVDHFNRINPGQRITYREVWEERRAAYNAQQVAQGKKIRDPGVNALEY